MATDPTQPPSRLEPAKQRVRVAKWALVLGAAASFGAATTLLARAGDAGTTPTLASASAVTTTADDEQAQESSEDFFGSGSVAPQNDLGSRSSSSSLPRAETRTS